VNVVDTRPRRRVLPRKPPLDPVWGATDAAAVALGGLAGAYKLVQFLIGILAFGIGPIVAVAYWIEGGTGLGGSISSYYNSDVRDLFVGLLFALGIMFTTYHFRPIRWPQPGAGDHTAPGAGKYKVDYGVDNWLANAAGLAAVLLALCPTDDPPHPPACRANHTCSAPHTLAGGLHMVWGVLLIALLVVFALLRFRKTGGERTDEQQKARRNRVYTICGCVMIGAVAAYALQRWQFHSWPSWIGFLSETTALWAFSLSWLLKSDYLPWLADRQVL
jgi:hypothetical protein